MLDAARNQSDASVGELASGDGARAGDAHRASHAAELIKSCVHCGFCLPACPTYALLGDERDSPRGRIYLIKQMAEGNAPSEATRTHLDRCLTCRACETACPSGVQYGKLIDVGREMVDAQSERPPAPRFARAVLGAVLSRRRVFSALLALGRRLRPVLPQKLADIVPPHRTVACGSLREPARARSTAGRYTGVESSVTLHRGCVQPALAPNIDASALRVLERAGTRCSLADNGCCGALNHHLGRHEAALAQMRHNVDVWTRSLAAGASAIVSTASGCAVMIKDYGNLLRDDARYASNAARVSEHTRDLSEVLEPLPAIASPGAERESTAREKTAREKTAPTVRTRPLRVAWHAPCTLQHGQKIRGRVEALLEACGYEVREPVDASRCCGSAGTYSILQPGISNELRAIKLKHLTDEAPDVIATANIGCLEHLRRGTEIPVRHWIELIDSA